MQRLRVALPQGRIDASLVFLGVQEQVFSNCFKDRSIRRRYGIRDDIEWYNKKGSNGGIPFNVRNAHQMDYLFRRAREQYRIKARELHPDTGGSHEEFVKLTRVWEYVERRFKRWGIE